MMKIHRIVTVVLLGLAITALADSAMAKPGNGRGHSNRPAAEPERIDREDVEEAVRDSWPTEANDGVSEFGERDYNSLPPGLQRRIEQGEGLPPGLQRHIEQGRGFPPGQHRR